jgi:hypothetical protein
MGTAMPFPNISIPEPSGTEETEEEGEDEDDESIVHHTASVGDDEVMGLTIELCSRISFFF